MYRVSDLSGIFKQTGSEEDSLSERVIERGQTVSKGSRQ